LSFHVLSDPNHMLTQQNESFTVLHGKMDACANVASTGHSEAMSLIVNGLQWAPYLQVHTACLLMSNTKCNILSGSC
jgi:hypothetical protein